MGHFGARRAREVTEDDLGAWARCVAATQSDRLAEQYASVLRTVLNHGAIRGIPLDGLKPRPEALTADPTLAAICADFVQSLKDRAALGQVRADYYQKPLALLRHYLGTLGALRAREVTEAHIQAWAVAIAAVQNETRAQRARTLLDLALQHGRIRGVQFDGLEPPPPVGSVAAMVLAWRREIEARIASGELADSGATLALPRLMTNRLGELLMVEASELDASRVLAWYEALSAQQGPRYAYRCVEVLRVLLKFTRRKGIAVADVAAGIQRPAELPRPPSKVLKRKAAATEAASPLEEEALEPIALDTTVANAAKVWLREDIHARSDGDQLGDETVRAYSRIVEYLKIPAQAPKHVGPTRPALGDFKIGELKYEDVKWWTLNVAAKVGKATAKVCLSRFRLVQTYWRGPKGLNVPDVTVGQKIKVEPKPARPLKEHELPLVHAAVVKLYEERLEDGRRRRLEGVDLAYHIAPHAALRVLFFSGPRITEVCTADAANLGSDSLYLPKTKTRVPRTLTLDRDAVAVARFMRSLVCEAGTWGLGEAGSMTPLFLHKGRSPKALRQAIGKVLRRAVILAGIPEPYPHPHDLRHTFAFLAIEFGWLLEHVALALGHRDPTITLEVYAKGARSPQSRQIAVDLHRRGTGGNPQTAELPR